MPSTPSAKSEHTTTIVSTVLPDGRLAELVYAPNENTTRLAVGLGDDVVSEESVTLPNGERLVPIPASNNLIRHRAVLLPESVGSFDSPESLADEVAAYVDRYLDLSPGFRAIASWYVLLSWVFDAFNELPPAEPPALKKTSSNAKCLPFPRITSRAAVLRAQRHVSDSLTTIRHKLSFRLIARLGQCPCCGRQSGKRLF